MKKRGRYRKNRKAYSKGKRKAKTLRKYGVGRAGKRL